MKENINMRPRKTKVVIPVMVLIWVQCLAMNPFPRGDDWMSWSAETILASVAAYVQAYGEGFRVGCFAGQQANATKLPKGTRAKDALAEGRRFRSPRKTTSTRSQHTIGPIPLTDMFM